MTRQGERSIGERVADARKGRGITQHALADRIHVSLSLLRKVEQGTREATPALVAAAAKALSVDVTALTGQPYDQDGRRPDRIHALVPRLRSALTYWDLPPDVPAIRTWQQLRVEAERAAVLRRAAQHVELVEMLPGTLMETTAAIHTASGRSRERLFQILTVLLFAAHSVTYKTGYEDLSTVVEDRMSWSADNGADPIMAALAAWARTTSMLQAGSYDIGLRLLDRIQDGLDAGRTDDLKALRVSGPLHLRSAILSARSGDAGTSSRSAHRTSESTKLPRASNWATEGQPLPAQRIFACPATCRRSGRHSTTSICLVPKCGLAIETKRCVAFTPLESSLPSRRGTSRPHARWCGCWCGYITGATSRLRTWSDGSVRRSSFLIGAS